MGRQLKTKDRKTWQVCRDHKTLQVRVTPKLTHQQQQLRPFLLVYCILLLIALVAPVWAIIA